MGPTSPCLATCGRLGIACPLWPRCHGGGRTTPRTGPTARGHDRRDGPEPAAVWPVVARAQQGDRVRRIGVLNTADETAPVLKARISAFIQMFADLGWTDGRNVRIDFRSGSVDLNRIRALAQELVGLKPDVILAITTPATVALQRETRTIPIIFSGVGDPVASGLVERLNRPGGNTTGFALYEPSLGGKWLELLSEIAPGLKRVAVMFNPDTAPALSTMPSLETAARSLKVVQIIAPVHSDAEIETAITTLGRDPGAGLVVMGDPFTAAHRAPIILAAARQRRRLALLRTRPRRRLSSCRLLCGSHSTRREAGGATRSVSDKIRDGRQPQDRQGAWPCRTAIHSAARRRGDRINCLDCCDARASVRVIKSRQIFRAPWRDLFR
jgi:putative tryptophan/tyrosine transport system substrate-binding protein